MPISRRDWLTGAGSVALASPLPPALASSSDVRDDFPIAKDRAYLNNASIHPMSLASLGAAQEYLRARTHGAGPTTSPDPPVPTREAKEGFAALIGAKPSEIAFVPSTTVGEHLVVAGLGIPHEKGNVVTDGLHFEGSLYQYRSLAAQGLDPVPDFVPPYESVASNPELARRYPLAMISPPARNFMNSTFVNVDSLRAGEREPACELNPGDAASRGIGDGDRTQRELGARDHERQFGEDRYFGARRGGLHGAQCASS